MIVPYSWLKDFLDFLPPPQKLAEVLLQAGLEVEDVREIRADFQGVKTGRVLSWKPHPTDPRLHVAQVELGEGEVLSVVCGAKNVFPGAIVPLALPGSCLKDREIQVREFGGVPSQGMLCSREELGLAPELLPRGEGGIAILPDDTPIGRSLTDLLHLPDYLLDIKVTPNRPDWFSIFGLAREISIFTAQTLHSFQERSENAFLGEDLQLEGESSSYLQVEILDPDLCYFYLSTCIFGVKIKESPLWLKSRLFKSGIRPINNVVDATNCIMLQTGQPLHAFDYDKVSQGKILVRRAYPGETIVTLDGKERALERDMLLIADPEKGIGIAGIMGGENSEISESTSRVVLESAYFAPFSIRRTARKLGLRTEASLRFERGTNMEQVEMGSRQATLLLAKLSSGKILRGEIRKGAEFKAKTVRIFPERVNFYLASRYSREKIISDLRKLHFKVREDGEELEVEVPPFRNDVKEDADLIEDIARLNGYQNIPSTLPRGEPRKGEAPLWKTRWRELRSHFLHFGLQEVITAPLVSPRINELTFLFAGKEEVKILNPISQDRSVLRKSLLPSLISVWSLNERIGKNSLGFFELGKVYLKREENELPEEPRIVGVVLSSRRLRNWRGEEETLDFFALKGLIQNAFRGFPLEFFSETCPSLHPGRQAALLLWGKKVGIMGELAPQILQLWDLKERLLVAEILLEPFLQKPDIPVFQPYPRFPSVRRDIAVILDEEVPYSRVEEVIKRAGGELLESLEFFDFYQGVNIPQGKKSLAFSLTFRHPQRTLLETEVNQFLERVEEELASQLKAELRKG